jgi:hypothetical protein
MAKKRSKSWINHKASAGWDIFNTVIQELKLTMPIINKRAMYEAYGMGLFGNKLRTWNSYTECMEDEYRGEVGFRYAIPGSPFFRYQLKQDELLDSMNEVINQGAKVEHIKIGESLDDSKTTIQGELYLSEKGLYLFYDTAPNTKMRDAMKQAVSAIGLKAKMILQHYMSPASYDDVMDLLRRYPDHIVEFTTCSVNIGSCKGRNTVIWEVRKY